MSWKAITLHGANSISRVASYFEVQDFRVPGTKYRVKVLERALGDFLALPNVCMKGGTGTPEWIAGLGRTETEALQDAVDCINEALASAERRTPEDFEWSDSRDF